MKEKVVKWINITQFLIQKAQLLFNIKQQKLCIVGIVTNTYVYFMSQTALRSGGR